MQVFAKAKDQWGELLVLPFKAYVVLVVPFYYLFRLFCPQPFLGTNASDGTSDILAQYFILCALVLLVTAAIQVFVASRRAALRTLAFAGFPTLVLVLVLLSAYRGRHWIEQHRNGAHSNLAVPDGTPSLAPFDAGSPQRPVTEESRHA